ncbi:NUDIX domain-containing protein [Algicella marina]|uniref:NUDIX domain-containing protein n=1 Tax=Algicella marina TaxID=2683284 RepID=A0A6P1T663_9RHOB|nr:NUDIX hydrolase [Algicella marina]QHQ36966.1 NUDIX domain-containing protein [Algicella marina]
MRRFGEPPFRHQRYTARPGAYAVILRGDRILVTEQDGDRLPEPEIQLPGGGIDPGESPVGALHREALEETGYRLFGLRRLGTYQRFTYMPDYDLWAQKICHIYLAAAGPRHGPPREPDHRPLWMSPADAVARLYSPGDQFYVRRATRR